MKKLTTIALAVCLAFALAAPAMAVDADFSGHYRVRGNYISQWNLRDTAPSKDFMDMRFRLETVFKVSDNLSVTTRFDALDGKVWGDADDANTAAGNIDFDRAYMTIKAPIGQFDIGRMLGGTWGTSFNDTAAENDRIKFTKTIEDMTLYLIYQKNTEADDSTTSTIGADEDSETYYVLGEYKTENTTAGLLLAFTNDKTTTSETKRTYNASPYFVSKFGPLGIQGELQYNWGQTDYDTAGSADLDIKELAYNIEASYSFGPIGVTAGYAFWSGDQATTDNEDSSYNDGPGNDWGKLFILTSDATSQIIALGDYGNLSKDGLANGTANTSGAKIIYGSADFSPLDNLTLGVVVGSADADEAPANYKDDYGLEYDFTLTWKIYDNLTYTAIAAFLDAGDYYWEQATQPANFDDTYALFHQLILEF